MNKLLCFAVGMLMTAGVVSAAAPAVSIGSDGFLNYTTDANGNRIIDFSYAGYEGGGVAIPVLPVARTVSPISGDNTASIQAAIDAVSALSPNANGFRGAVLLQPGTYNVSGTLNINASGVVLRGSGSGTNGTVFNMTGSPHLMVSIAGSGTWTTSGSSPTMTDAYVPSGTMSFNVSSVSGFSVGDTILVNRPVTSAWIHLMGMDVLKDSTGAAQTWISAGTVITADRVITAISGNKVTLNAPVCDSYDSTYLTGSITRYTFPGRISQSGVEHFSVISPAVNVDINSPQFMGLTMTAVSNAWANDVTFQDTQNTITINQTATQVTLTKVNVNHTAVHTGDRMADFGLSGTQIFVDRCSSNGTGEWPLVTQGKVTGPNVVLNLNTTQQTGVGPHQRWAVGLLADSCSLPNAPDNPDGGATGISFSDRGNHGSGQGWAMGWGVAWNVTTPYFVVQMPPGGYNWCYGAIGAEVTAVEAGSGKTVPNGVYVSLGSHVLPASLYLEQLLERLGPVALSNIGYGTPPVVAAPAFSPAGGTYTSAQSVTLSTATSGASIRYTTDGSTPTSSTGTLYSGPVAVSTTTTVKAIAFETGMTDSAVTSATYTINIPKAAAPTFSPGSGTYTSAQSVTITSATSGASIRYTTDGSAPTESHGTVYSGAVSIGGNTTLQAIAYESGFTDSSISLATYTIMLPVADPAFSPAGGTYTSAQSVTITSATSGASIRYTTDGSAPTESNGTIYSGPVNLGSTTTLQAIAYKSGFTDSAVTSATYTINIVGPVTLEAENLSPVGTGATVSISNDANASGGVVEFLNATAAGQTMTLTTPSIAAGTYQIQLRYKTNTTRGQHTVKIDGVQVGGTVDQYATTSAYTTVTLGNATLATSGAHTIVLTVTGKNAAATQFYITADTLTFTPVQPQAAAPVFSPGGGSYTSAQSVTITSATSGATLRYTTDGSTPSETAGTIYSGPVSIGATATLKAIAYKTGFTDSTVTSAAYTITLGPPPTVNLEAESLSPVGTGATVSISNDANASGGVVEFLNSTAAGQTMTLTTTSIVAGTYQIQLRYKTNTTRGQHTVKIDGVQVGGTVDQYATTSVYTTVTLGNVTFGTAGTHTIVLAVTGKNSASGAFLITADKFTFVGQ